MSGYTSIIHFADDHAAEPISSELFGAIYTGYRGLSAFTTQADLLKVSHVRWPGGTLAEIDENVYGLDISGLFDGTQLYSPSSDRVRPDLSEMLSFSTSRDVPITLIVPTARYANDISRGESELRHLLDDLLSEVHGALPDRLILEIGNEYSSRTEFSDNPTLYGVIANRFVSVIEAAALQYGKRVEVAVQMGVDHADDLEIRSQFDATNLMAIDALVSHHLPISLRNAHRNDVELSADGTGVSRFDRISSLHETWQDAIRAVDPTQGEPELYLSAWTVGAPALPGDIVDFSFNDYGLKAASTALDMIWNHARIGVDMAAVWGIDVINFNKLGLQQGGTLEITPFGAMFGMLAETLPGTIALPGAEHFARSDPYNIYGFLSDDRLALYATVNDVPEGRTTALSVLLDGVLPFWPTAGRSLTADLPANIATGDSSDALHERPVVTGFQPSWIGKDLNFVFSEDNEVQEVIIELPAGLDWGSDFSDTLVAETAGGFLFGFNGDDQLHGGVGDDWLDGGAGSDRLIGGGGTDRLFGGKDADVFVVISGAKDVIIGDFEPGEDTIEVHSPVPVPQINTSSPPGSAIAALTNFIRSGAGPTVSASATTTGTKLTIDTAFGDSAEVLLEGIVPDELGATDFLFL